MKEDETTDEERDYFYLIVNKNNTSDIFPVSLKGISDCKAAHNNPPFQVKWDNCREPVERDWNGARSYLLGLFAESITKTIENAQRGMPTAYPEFFAT